MCDVRAPLASSMLEVQVQDGISVELLLTFCYKRFTFLYNRINSALKSKYVT